MIYNSDEEGELDDDDYGPARPASHTGAAN